MTGLQIGVAIKSALSASTALTEAVGTKVFPIVSKEGTSYPFIVYRRNGLETSYTKDGRASETVNVDIVVAANSYAQSISIADMVRDAIDGKGFIYTGTGGTLTVRDCQLTSADEEIFEDSNVYTQTLNFNLFI